MRSESGVGVQGVIEEECNSFFVIYGATGS
jgi:hypothetical protein